VIGCSQRPKPWRIPIDTVTIAAPQISTCVSDNAGRAIGLVLMRSPAC